MIPYGKQHIDEDDIAAVVATLTSERLTQGPAIERFEQALAAYCAATYAVACSNGTTALHLAYLAAGIGPGDEVIMPSNTFSATANMVLQCGARPVFCDIDPATYNIDQTKIEALITDKTKAIVPVHFAGLSCEMKIIAEIARRHNLFVIEDACQALGGAYEGGKIGGCAYSDMAVFSFHPVKSITMGEGGAILTNSQELYRKLIQLRTHGITKEPELLKENHGPWYYETQYLSNNYRITDIQCALGASQLTKLDRFIARRKEIAEYYFAALQGVSNLILPEMARNNDSAWHLFVVRVDRHIRRKLVEQLHAAGVGVQIHFIPVHTQPLYKERGYTGKGLEQTEAYYETCLSLPIFPDLVPEKQQFVINTLQTLLASYE